MKAIMALVAFFCVSCGRKDEANLSGSSNGSEANSAEKLDLDSDSVKKEKLAASQKVSQVVSANVQNFVPPGVAPGTPHGTSTEESGSFVSVTVICGAGENREKKFVELASPIATAALLLNFARSQCSSTKSLSEHFGQRAIPGMTLFNWMYIQCFRSQASGYVIKPAGVVDPNWVWRAAEQKCGQGMAKGAQEVGVKSYTEKAPD